MGKIRYHALAANTVLDHGGGQQHLMAQFGSAVADDEVFRSSLLKTSSSATALPNWAIRCCCPPPWSSTVLAARAWYLILPIGCAGPAAPVGPDPPATGDRSLLILYRWP